MASAVRDGAQPWRRCLRPRLARGRHRAVAGGRHADDPIWGATAPRSTWPGLAIGLWLFAQLLVVPMCWAAARMDFERRRERQKRAA